MGLRSFSLTSLFFAVLALVPMWAQAQDKLEKNKALSFAVVPQQATAKLARLWIPILQYVERETGQRIVFKTAPDIPTFEKRLMKGEYDIAYMNPYHYVVFADNPGYRAFAKQKDKRITGLLVVGNESGIEDVHQLDGLTLVFPSPGAFAASILTRAFLANEGISIKVEYVSSHDSVYRNVAAGRFIAGGGITRTLKALNSDVSAQLRVLWTSPGFTPHAFAAHGRVDAESLEKIQRALVGMQSSEEGMALLKAIKFNGIEKADTSDWDDVRSLNIPKNGIETGLH